MDDTKRELVRARLINERHDLDTASQICAPLGVDLLASRDLILTEVLRGFRQDADYQTAKRLLTAMTIYGMLGTEQALKSAENFRALRKRGVTVRKTADVIIATFCIESEQPALLFFDRDFVPYVEHLDLRPITCKDVL